MKAKPDHSLLAFFRPRAALNLSTVSAPPPVHALLVSTRTSAVATDSESNLLSQSAQAQAVSKDLPESCLLARGLLHNLSKKIKGIPKTIPLANNDHRLAIFLQDLATCIRPELDDWKDILNPMMKWAFGWGANLENLEGLARCGWHGLDGFYRFMEYFIIHRKLKGGLVESKFGILLAAIDFECVILCSCSRNLP